MFNSKCFIVLVVIAICADSVRCEYFTSISSLERLLEAEGLLLDSLKDLGIKTDDVEAETFFKVLDHIREEYVEAKNDSFAYISNPISAFKLIKRFLVDWTIVEESLTTLTSTEIDLMTNLTRTMNSSFDVPSTEDLVGASLGLVRLQETYALNAAELAEGKILGTKYSSEMTSSDCLSLGLSLYMTHEYKRALPWILEALTKIKKDSHPPREKFTHILKYLSVTFYNLDNPKMALVITNDILSKDPLDKDALENKKFYMEKYFEDRNSRRPSKQPFVKPKEPSDTELTAMVCRGELRPTPGEQRPLRCMYSTNNKPYRILAPLKAEQLSLDPLIVYYHDVVPDSILDKIIEQAKPNLLRSETGDTESIDSDFRISKTSWLDIEDHDFLTIITKFLNDTTGLSLGTAEALQVVNYGIGGHYVQHVDFSETPVESYGEWRGNRIATALFYLSDVELGGATVFPMLKVAVPAVKGGMVLWYNLHDSLEMDFRMWHSGCPVLKGFKWIMTEWYHERGQEFLKPCSLDLQGEKSASYRYVNGV